MTDTTDKPKRQKRPTARIKTYALPDGDPRKPVKKPRERKPPKPKPAGLEFYPQPRETTDGLNDTARKLVAAMVWEGLARDDAIKSVAISKNYAYELLRRPEVKAHYLAELDVLRTSQQARAQHRLAEIADQNDNMMAAVQAVKLIQGEQQRGAPPGSPVNVTLNIQPGYVIDPTAAFANDQPPKLMTIDHIPKTDQLVIPSRGNAAPVIAGNPPAPTVSVPVSCLSRPVPTGHRLPVRSGDVQADDRGGGSFRLVKSSKSRGGEK